MTLVSPQTARPEDVFQDFFRSYLADQIGSKYRKRLAQVAVTNGLSLVIDFDDLIAFDPALARSVTERPDDFIGYASSAATAQMRVEDPEYAEHAGRIFARFRRLPEKRTLRKIGAEDMKKLALVEGIVVRTTQVRPMILKAVFRCRKCLEIVQEEQSGDLMRGPGPTCPSCKQKTAWELLEDQCKFKNTQEARVQERPEDLPPGQLPRYLDVRLEDDLVDTARPGDRVAVTSIVRAEKQYVGEKGRLRTFELYLEANFVDVVGKETEVIEITREDEKKILEASKDPFVHRKLIMSLAPSIYGYGEIKEGILYLLFGGVSKHLPDGVSIRGDINALLIGDPGCLIGDERIVLGDGTIAKIQDLGQIHLESIDVRLQTGQGGAKTETATRFHIYHNQPTLEIVTESGKSIRGTHNHPLLAVETENQRLLRRWKRLDELRVGDRLAVVTGFPCYSRRVVKTGFKPLPYNRGPRFHGSLPEKVTPALGAFLGYLLGDGWVQRYRVGFLVADGEKDLLAPLCEMARNLFGINPRVTSRKTAGRNVVMHHAIIGSQVIASNLSFMREKRVPNFILASGNEVVVQFLKWLYEADGTVFSSKRGCGAIGLKAKNIELLRDVQILLLRFGIHSRIIGNALLTRRGESILKFAQKVGFVSNKKRVRLADLEGRAKIIKRFGKQHSERIVAIYNREPADVYDIEVPRGHRFIANGIISHNTAKSQLLQYVSRIAPRGLYTSGRGTTAAGLTAAVLREKTGGMVLEAGALVLADKGIACLHPDSQVIIGGLPARICDLFDSQTATITRTKTGRLLKISTLGRRTVNLDLNHLKTRESMATLVTEREYEGPLLHIHMKSGFELRVTPDHLLLEGPSLSWRSAEEILAGDRLLTIQRLPSHHDKVRILEIIPDDWIVQPTVEERLELRKRVLTRFSSLAAANRNYGLRREALSPRGRDAIPLRIFRRILSDLDLDSWRDHVFAYGRKKRTEWFRVAHITPDLAYVLGFIYGDGYARSDSKHSTVRVAQSGLHREYINRFLRSSKMAFDASWRDSQESSSGGHPFRVHNLRRDSNLLFALYDWVTRNSLQNLLRLGQDELAGFLAGAMDADGCLSTKRHQKNGKEYRTVDVTFSLSDDLDSNRVLILALRRFDVYARIRQQKGVKNVQTTGREDATRLVRALAPYSSKCRDIPPRSTLVSPDNEEVPRYMLTRILKEVKVVPSMLLQNGTWSTFYELRAGSRRPFKQGVRRLRDNLDTWLSTEQAAGLDALSESDYAMDEVVHIETTLYKGPVYDLRVPEGSSFLADGVCVHNCIDELDKMRPDDRVAIHEALEQQTVSVAKGGIVATLNARASVLAAANPALGRYEPHKNVNENINLPVTILSRFDLIFLVKDTPEPENDSRMSDHILSLHKTKHTPEEAPFAPEFLRKYISYAKRIVPTLTPDAVKELQDFYLKMRNTTGKEAAVAITPRQLEGLVRISEARARAFLREEVTVEDAKSAVKIMSYALYDVGVDVKTGKIDIDTIMTGKPATVRDSLGRVMAIIAELERETGTVEEKILMASIVDREKITDGEARRFVGQLIKEGMIYSPKEGRLKRTSS